MSTVPASAAVPRPSRPVFTLRQASSSDAATLSLIRSLAFGSPSDPIQRQVWPFSVSSFDSYVSYVEEVMKWEMRDHQRRGGSGEWWVVETDQGEAAATGQWEVFDRNPHKGIGEGEPEPKHSDTNEALFQDYFGRQDVAHKEIMGSQPHIYVQILTTHPRFQRQGATSLLLSHLTSLADTRRLPIYLSASPAGKPLYERYGFVKDRVFECKPEDGWEEAFEQTIMIRPPKEAAPK